MKQLMVFMMALGLVTTASAQGKIRTPQFNTQRPRVVVVAPSYGYGYGYGFGYRNSPFFSPYGSLYYSPFNDPFYRSRVVERVPSELQLQIDEIENDYAYQISTLRHDKSIAGKEKRQQIRDLKHQREDAKIEAKRSWYKQKKEKSDG